MRNHTLLCDFYELTMANGYFELGKGDEIAYFDVFFRTLPDGGGFAIAAGLEQLIEYIEDLHFSEEDIEFLRSKNISNGESPYIEFAKRTYRQKAHTSRILRDVCAFLSYSSSNAPV